MDSSGIYEQAGRLMAAGTEAELEQAAALFGSLPGYLDADRRRRDCETLLARMRWQRESVQLKAQEDRFEQRVTRWKRVGLILLTAALLFIGTIVTVSLIRFARYNKAAELYTAGEYASAAAAFQDMGDYRDARARVFMSAVELYKAKRYEEALPYFVWLNGYIDNGYYLRKCQERLGLPDASAAAAPHRA